MILRILILIFFLQSTFNLQLRAQKVISLWEEGHKPFYKENTLQEHEKEAWSTKCIYDITEPTLSIYPAKGKNSGKAVLIIPGGGYSLVAAVVT